MSKQLSTKALQIVSVVIFCRTSAEYTYNNVGEYTVAVVLTSPLYPESIVFSLEHPIMVLLPLTSLTLNTYPPTQTGAKLLTKQDGRMETENVTFVAQYV